MKACARFWTICSNRCLWCLAAYECPADIVSDTLASNRPRHAAGTKDIVMASAFLRQCSRPAVKALLKQSEPRLYLEGDALFEEVLWPGNPLLSKLTPIISSRRIWSGSSCACSCALDCKQGSLT